MSDATLSSKTTAIEHIRIASRRPFAKVRAALESSVPSLDPTIADALRDGDEGRVRDYETSGPSLSIFLHRDHGSLLAIAGSSRSAIQYEIGNPVTASKMTRHVLEAGLYAPLRIILFEDEYGCGVFEYDRPSSFFGQFGDPRVTAIGLDLDDALQRVLLVAASL